MNTNGVSNNNVATYQSAITNTAEKGSAKSNAASETAAAKNNSGVTYEASKKEDSSSTKKTYKKDSATINTLMNDLKQREQQMKDLVEKTLMKQGQTLSKSQSIFDVLKSGKVTFAADDIMQAKKDVAEDGYWGVEQTSERLYSFAYALTGGDPSKADKMMSAIEKGFSQATKSWGGELPSISKDTLEATREKIQAWKDGSNAENVNNELLK